MQNLKWIKRNRLVLARDMNSLAIEEVGYNFDLRPSQNDVHWVVKKCEPLETQAKVGIWPFWIELKYVLVHNGL